MRDLLRDHAFAAERDVDETTAGVFATIALAKWLREVALHASAANEVLSRERELLRQIAQMQATARQWLASAGEQIDAADEARRVAELERDAAELERDAAHAAGREEGLLAAVAAIDERLKEIEPTRRAHGPARARHIAARVSLAHCRFAILEEIGTIDSTAPMRTKRLLEERETQIGALWVACGWPSELPDDAGDAARDVHTFIEGAHQQISALLKELGELRAALGAAETKKEPT